MFSARRHSISGSTECDYKSTCDEKSVTHSSSSSDVDTGEVVDLTDDDAHISMADLHPPHQHPMIKEEAKRESAAVFESPSPQQEAPYHVFSPRLKGFLVFIVSLVATLSGLSSNIYFPAQTQISQDLDITPQLVNISITTYMIAQGLGPSFWAVLADRQGRRVTLVYTLALYVGANIALGLTVDGAMLLAFRALQALGSASTIALGAGVIADFAPRSERGGYLGWFSGLRQLSIALGPVLGGLLAGTSGWRSIFWFLTGFSGLAVLLILLFLPETLRRIAGNGSTPLTSWVQRPILWSFIRKQGCRGDEESIDGPRSQGEIRPAAPFRFKNFLEPFMYLAELDVACALGFGGCVYTAWTMMVATTTFSLQKTYHFTTIQVGLCFLANGFGCVAGSIIAGRSLNTDFSVEVRLWQHANRQDPDTNFPVKSVPSSFPLEKARLTKGRVYSLVAIWSLLLYGWSLTAQDRSVSTEGNAFFLTPLLAQFAVGWSATSVLSCNNALVVDLYQGKSASVSALMNLTRCLMGAAGVAGVQPFLERYGPGYTSVLLAGIVLLGLVPYTLHCNYGQEWRRAREERRMKAGTQTC